MGGTAVIFSENGRVDAAQLNTLYRLVGWDSRDRRTEAETLEMLRASHYYIAAHTAVGELVGFARVCGDPYVAQVLDVITHPEYRRRGIATRCMQGVRAHLRRSRYVTVSLTDGSGVPRFYERFGFRPAKDPAQVWDRDGATAAAALGRHAELDERYRGERGRATGAIPQLRTTDLAGSIRFYTKTLGLTLEFQYEDFYAGIRAGRQTFHLKLVDDKDPSIDYVTRGDHFHLYLETDDATATAEALRRAGVKLVRDVHDTPWGTRELALRDDQGHTLYFGESR